MEVLRAVLEKKSREILIGLGGAGALALLGGLVWFMYQSYTRSINEQAQLAFAENMEFFNKAQALPEASVELWQEVAAGFARAYISHKSSSLAPYFLAYQSDALLRVGEVQQAMALLEKAVPLMKKSPLLHELYGIKYALFLLDSDDKALQEKGKNMLLQAAQNHRGSCQALAWYYLWEYAYLYQIDDLLALASAKVHTSPLLDQQVRLLSEPAV